MLLVLSNKCRSKFKLLSNIKPRYVGLSAKEITVYLNDMGSTAYFLCFLLHRTNSVIVRFTTGPLLRAHLRVLIQIDLTWCIWNIYIYCRSIYIYPHLYFLPIYISSLTPSYTFVLYASLLLDKYFYYNITLEIPSRDYKNCSQNQMFNIFYLDTFFPLTERVSTQEEVVPYIVSYM